MNNEWNLTLIILFIILCAICGIALYWIVKADKEFKADQQRTKKEMDEYRERERFFTWR